MKKLNRVYKLLCYLALSILTIPIVNGSVLSDSNNITTSELSKTWEYTPVERLEIRKAPLTPKDQSSGFLYVVVPDTRRIGIITTDGVNPFIWGKIEAIGLDINSAEIDLNQVTVLECGKTEGFTPRKGYASWQKVWGNTGYESVSEYCHIARNMELKWFNAKQLIDKNLWYSRDLDGDIQCYSLDGINCTNLSDFSGNINDKLTSRLAHKTKYICRDGDKTFHDSVCEQLRAKERSFLSNSTQEIIDSKINYMDNLFDLLQKDKWKQVNEEYVPRLDELQHRISAHEKAMAISCSIGIVTIWGAIACAIQGELYDDLVAEQDALLGEYNAKYDAATAYVEEIRAKNWHKLHQQWAQNDNTHLAGLLKEESLALDDLKHLKAGYEQKATEKHKEYLAAVKKYMDDTKPGNILLHSIEDMPLIGPEVKHIVDYAENPSSKNLRRMLLGLAGPVGEATEGILELTLGESTNKDKIKFLSDVLTDLDQSHSVGEALESIVSDAINDLGDEAIESIRQAGLWVDKPSDDPALEIDYTDVVDLRARSSRFEYDPWTDTGAHAPNFNDKFSPPTHELMPIPPGFGTIIDVPIHLRGAHDFKNGPTDFTQQVAAIFAHSMGRDYASVVKKSSKYKLLSSFEVDQELYKVIADPAYQEQRIPHWVTSEVIGQRPAGLLYDDDHAVIVFNSDLLNPTDDLSKFYFEELGHLVNWWRCKIFDVAIRFCEVNGDVGARFRDAVLIDPKLHDSNFQSLLSQLPAHLEVDRVPVKFNNNELGFLEGWPHYYTLNDHIAAGKFNFLMRLGLDVASEWPSVSDEFDIELSITAPTSSQKGNPWRQSENGYCKNDTETDCNMPTMWVTVSFRDAIKFSIAKAPKIKDTKFSKSGADLSPRIVRKHGGKLPFQLKSVNGTDWGYQSAYNIYYKKFTGALETKLDLWKFTHAIKKRKPSSIHKPEFSLKATPGQASYLVEIATRDKSNFEKWLALDITSAIAGCVGGFILGVIAETDPVVMCHGFSDIVEALETVAQTKLDNAPTVVFEADGNITLPTSLEYKYATSGNKIMRNKGKTVDSPDFSSGRVTYDKESSQVDTNPASVTETTNPQIAGFKSKVNSKFRKAFSKLGEHNISPIGVFRFRIGFEYKEIVINRGKNNLPSKIVSD